MCEKAGVSGRKCQVLVRKQMLEREKAIPLGEKWYFWEKMPQIGE